MADAGGTILRPAVYSIPPHRAFADALAAGLIARHGRDKLALARGLILIPNNRAARAITGAFVRRAGGGLLLPRLVAIGDPELDERVGALLDPVGEADPIPPAIEPLQRAMMLTRLVSEARAAAGDPIDAPEAARLARDLARTLDQLIVEEVPPLRLRDAVVPELSEHWQHSLAVLEVILSRWPSELAKIGRIDLADRRNRLLDRVARRWAASPPPGIVVAAGISTTAPAIARVLRSVARSPQGMVVLPGIDGGMAEEEWDALGPHEPQADGRRRRAIETHPQFQLKMLLDRMGIARGEVQPWRWGGGRDAPAVRTRAIGHAMAPAAHTHRWQALKTAERRLSGVRALELATPAQEAQAIAITMRETLETPGRTVALVTPDRALARRVVAHLGRWGIAADDSAGQPLSAMPAGALLLALAEAAAEGFAPVPLLALLKHPLVRLGEERLPWLEGVRALDKALRGPRPAPGLTSISERLASLYRIRQSRAEEGATDAGARRDDQLRIWWSEAEALLAPLETAFASATSFAALLAAVREAATALAGDAAWSRTDGRAAAELIAGLEAHAAHAPAVRPADIPLLLRHYADAVAVRPPQGGHPRIFIWGLIEARLQQADVMILGGLNEGSWPAAPAPDPWLAPRIRSDLGLPGLERRIGLAAHDFAMALGGPQVLVTRARRDARAPAIASRFWLRLEAMTGGLTRATKLVRWTSEIDHPGEYKPADRPAPTPPQAERPARIAVTKLDRLKADPFAFYADAMLRLRSLDAVDADPTPAWRGSAVHDVLECWMKEDDCDPAALRPRAERMLAEIAAHPVLRALWAPRLIEAIEWVAATMTRQRAEGREPLTAEIMGETQLGGVTLYGKVDRIDRLADRSLAIVDYKTGKPPGRAQVAAGYAMQVGLLGLIAERGGFADVEGVPSAFEYWSLAAQKGKLGYVVSPAGRSKQGIGVEAEDFTAHAARVFADAAAKWLTGEHPFTAKLHPEFAPYGDYDQLMRLDEWYGRQDG